MYSSKKRLYYRMPFSPRFNKMNLRLRLPSKKILMRTLLCVLMLVLGLMIFVWVRLENESVMTDSMVKQTAKSTYILDNIPHIDRVFASVGKTFIDSNQIPPSVEVAILPHHTDIGLTIDQYWAEIASNTKPEVIVIVSPAHWDQGDGTVQTTHGQWKTPFGIVKTDDALIEQLREDSPIFIEPASFENEHGIAVHTPYIAHYFPEVQIIPIIAQSQAGSTKAVELTKNLLGLEKNILLISSIDFSHYLSAEISDRHDEETRRVIASNDVDRIDQMGPDYLDSSFALEVYLYWHSFSECRSQERWHNHNSRMFPGIRSEEGTSYFVYSCAKRSPLRISAVGDMMLDRGVGEALDRHDAEVQTSLLKTTDLLKSVTADSDLMFGNLESVLSNKGKPLNKAYVFEADPRHVELLKKWNFSHLSVSNNHSEDYGKEAWEQSVEIVRREGMTPIGGYTNESDISTTVVGEKRIAFLAFQNLTVPFSFEKAADTIKEAKQTHDFVVVSMHWGTEYKLTPDPQTINLAHATIDAGADIILGHHPHVIQPVETYKGKLIFYSFGNFVFDQIGEEQNKSIIATIDLWESGELTYVLTPVTIEKHFPRAQ